MSVKVTMFFTLDKYSWSEDHYDLSASSGDLPAEVPRAQALANYRATLLGYDAALERVRISSVPANQQVVDVEFASNLQGSWAGGGPGVPAYTASRAFVALLTRIQGSNGLHRNYYLSGAPAGLFHSRLGDDTGIDFSQVPEFLLRYLGFTNFLTSGGWGWLSRAGAVLTQAAGLSTSAQAPGMVVIFTDNPVPGVVRGSKVQVGGWRRISVKACPKLSGVYVVGAVLPPVAPATQTGYALVNTAAIVPANFFTLGKIGPLLQAAVGYASASPVECVERKRGATLLRPRGRRRTGA